MSKFDEGDWVGVGLKENDCLGRVVEVLGRHQVRIRLFDRNGFHIYDDKELKRCPRLNALVLEGSLDKQLTSTRSEEGVLRAWLRTHNALLAYKNIHTLRDIDVIGRALGNVMPAFVHVSCHGNIDKKTKRPYIVFAPAPRKADRIFLGDDETIQVFAEYFSGVPILFSACWVGKYQDDISKFCKDGGFKHVAAFTRIVDDSEAILFELLVYHGILENNKPFKKSVDDAIAALKELGIRGSRGQELARVFSV